ncbi:MAG: FKBP-type peptidyl-prolyl cis-trans isomerase FklB [Flavobacteriales bacterium]|jgi:FKBP-type peptidyl-prolyl cis-trans isomerase FklB
MSFTSEKEKVSYALGLSMAANLAEQGFKEVDTAALAQGLQHHFERTDLLMQPEEMQQVLGKAFQAVQESMKAEAGVEGEAFLAENAKKDGITVLESGLQYRVITEGSGAKPAATDQVTTHYHGMLINGKVFDSSVDRGEPATFPVNGVITGWVEALQLMPVGSKWELFIPYNLAYGERGAGADIKPYSTLIFEVELIAIV